MCLSIDDVNLEGATAGFMTFWHDFLSYFYGTMLVTVSSLDAFLTHVLLDLSNNINSKHQSDSSVIHANMGVDCFVSGYNIATSGCSALPCQGRSSVNAAKVSCRARVSRIFAMWVLILRSHCWIFAAFLILNTENTKSTLREWVLLFRTLPRCECSTLAHE